MSKDTVKLPKGSMPVIGLGTWQSKPGEVRKAVEHALKSGYRHLDCAWAYGNEKEVGEGIKDSGVPREEIWITSKLYEHHHEPDQVKLAIEDTLKNLQTDYLDLYLTHWPSAIKPKRIGEGKLSREWALNDKGKPDTDYKRSEDHSEMWSAMEKLVEEGKVRNIGISNFNIHRTRNLLKHAKIPPAVNQVELSLQNSQPELVDWMQKHNIVVEAYSPLGSTGSPLRDNETVQKIAKKHNVDPATILLSWLISRNIVVLPKSVTPSRIESNLKHVALDKEEVDALTAESDKIPSKRVCDQSEDFEWDIYEEKHSEHNDKVQAKKD